MGLFTHWRESLEGGHMKHKQSAIFRFSHQQGAALPMVLLVTFLLVTASIAMLSAATANSRNGTDVVSETKAYYAAESGIQSAINILRNQNVNYKDAVNAIPPNLSTWRSTNWTAPDGSTAGLSVGGEGGYTLKVTDPDNSQTQIAFTTDTSDTVGNASSGFSVTATTFAPKLSFPNPTAADRTEITWVPDNQGPHVFGGSPDVKVSLGSFKIENIGNGSAIPSKVFFRVNFRLDAPDNPTWVIKGTIDPAASNRIVFQSYLYAMVGSDITLCSTSNCATPISPNINLQTITAPVANASSTKQFWVQLTPKQPQRLLLESEGFGPNGSRKKLQAFINKSFFPLVPPAAGLLMNGPNAYFDNGNGRPHYDGCDPADPAVCVPAIGTTDATGLANINGATFKDPPNPNPPPAIVGEDLPEWQRTPEAMDQQISQWRNVTPTGSRYANNATINTGGFGDFATGKGLTFCEGNCTIQGNGGGILVVKGKLTTFGGVSFRGYIVVVGADGILRNGNGGPDDQIIGGVIVSPYTLTPSPGHWLQPRFSVNGGGSSYIKYSSLEYLFDGGITGTTNFVSGIVEK